MQRFIGLDVHGQSCTMVVIGPSAWMLGQHVVETNAKAVIDQIHAVAGDKHLCMEEGTQSGWLYEVLPPLTAHEDVADHRSLSRHLGDRDKQP
jgi:hypothetical protein